MSNGIGVNINSEISYVGTIYIIIKYQDENVIWLFILVSFYFLYSNVTNVFISIQF